MQREPVLAIWISLIRLPAQIYQLTLIDWIQACDSVGGEIRLLRLLSYRQHLDWMQIDFPHLRHNGRQGFPRPWRQDVIITQVNYPYWEKIGAVNETLVHFTRRSRMFQCRDNLLVWLELGWGLPFMGSFPPSFFPLYSAELRFISASLPIKPQIGS
jgi:hypothetical protein